MTAASTGTAAALTTWRAVTAWHRGEWKDLNYRGIASTIAAAWQHGGY